MPLKAFDTLEHYFIFSALKKFGFSNYFIKTIKTLYFNNCSIKLHSGTSPRFNLNRGIRQGSALFFPILTLFTTTC